MRIALLAVLVASALVACSSSSSFTNIQCMASVSGNTEAFPCDAHADTVNGTSVITLSATGADSAQVVAMFSRTTLAVGSLKQTDAGADDSVEYVDAAGKVWIAAAGAAGMQGTYELSITQLGPKSGTETPLHGALMANLPPQGMPSGTALIVQATF